MPRTAASYWIASTGTSNTRSLSNQPPRTWSIALELQGFPPLPEA